MKDKKNILLILMSISLVVLLVLTIHSHKSEAQQQETVFKTADGKVVKIIRDEYNVSQKNSQSEEVRVDGDTDEEIYYGAIISINGSKERVYAIADDGSFITEVIEERSNEASKE